MKRVRPSRPALAYSFSTLRLNLVITHGITLDFRGAVHLLIPLTTIESIPSLSDHAFRTNDCVHCQESAGTESVTLEVIPVTGAAFFRYHGPINVRLLLPTPTFIGIRGCLVVVWVSFC